MEWTKVSESEIRTQLERLLTPRLSPEMALQLVDIFTDAELDGIHSHGLKRLPRFLREIEEGSINPAGQMSRLTALGAWEVWDGDAAPGPLSALTATQRAMQLAQEHGIGCVSLRNTNHWLRPGYYGKYAATQGCALVCWSNTLPNTVPHGGSFPSLGNNPLTIAIPGQPAPFLLDMAVSQFSYGKMQAYEERGEQLPVAGGYDENGQTTCDPAVIRERMSASAIGLWKGTGLSMALDLLVALFSNGQSTHEIGRKAGEVNISQAFIAWDLHQLYGENLYTRAAELVDQLRAINPEARVPGQSLAARRAQHLAEGVDVDAALWRELIAMR